ncbi:helix-turn-helix domain-containing protein [Methylobacterium sp. CM6257]
MNGKSAHSIAEVIERAGSSRTTIYAEIAAGRLKARKLGRRTLILDKDLEDWLATLPLARKSAV